MNILRLLLIALSLAGVALSAVTVDLHVKLRLDPSLMPSYCHLSETVNCSPVIGSAWSSILGIPLGSFAIIFYLVIVALVVMESGALGRSLRVRPHAIFVLALFSVVLSLGLFLISKFVIGAVCPVCIAMYVVNVSLFAGAWALSKGISWVTCIGGGISDLLTAPLKLFGTKNREGVSVAGKAWVLFVFFILVGAGSLGLPFLDAERLINSPEFKANVDKYIDEVVAEWKAAPVSEIPEPIASGFSADYTKGSVSAPIHILEYSDFECPACRRFYDELHEILEEYGPQIYLIHRNFPIDRACNSLIKNEAHQNACYAAFFARCAGEQGRFWDVADFLFSLPAFDNHESAEEVRHAINNGVNSLALDEIAMKECLASDRPRNKIVEDIALADRLKLEGTPSVWINGKKVSIANGEAIRRIIKASGKVQ